MKHSPFICVALLLSLLANFALVAAVTKARSEPATKSERSSPSTERESRPRRQFADLQSRSRELDEKIRRLHPSNRRSEVLKAYKFIQIVPPRYAKLLENAIERVDGQPLARGVLSHNFELGKIASSLVRATPEEKDELEKIAKQLFEDVKASDRRAVTTTRKPDGTTVYHLPPNHAGTPEAKSRFSDAIRLVLGSERAAILLPRLEDDLRFGLRATPIELSLTTSATGNTFVSEVSIGPNGSREEKRTGLHNSPRYLHLLEDERKKR